MNTTESNKLIARFMGFEIGFSDTENPCILVGNVWTPLRYHFSWEALMPVFENICNTQRFVTIHRSPEGEEFPLFFHDISIKANYCHIKVEFGRRFKEFGSNHYGDDKNMLDSVYSMIVDFIKWYNENNA